MQWDRTYFVNRNNLTLVIFDEKGDGCREKFCISMENYSTHCEPISGYSFPNLSFQLFSHLPNMASLRIKPLFSQSPAIWSWKTRYKFQRNHNSFCVNNLHACCWVGSSECSLELWGPHQRPNLKAKKFVIFSLLSSIYHLKRLPCQHLEVFSTGSPLDSEPGFATSNLCFSFIFIEILPLNAQLLILSSKYPLQPSFNRWFSWSLMSQR